MMDDRPLWSTPVGKGGERVVESSVPASVDTSGVRKNPRDLGPLFLPVVEVDGREGDWGPENTTGDPRGRRWSRTRRKGRVLRWPLERHRGSRSWTREGRRRDRTDTGLGTGDRD